MESVAVHFGDFLRALHDVGEAVACPYFVPHQLVVRIRTFDRLSKRTDNAAVRDVQLDSPPRIGGTEIGRTDFGYWLSGQAAAKEGLVPVDAVTVIAQEKIGFLDTVRQANMAGQHFVQPGSTGAADTNRDKIWQCSVT